MKTIIISLVCLFIISSSFLFASPFHGGNGTQVNPYQIYNEAELLALVNANNSTTWSQYFKLTNDITCSGSYTNTIGNSSKSFTGYFDGQGHNINNLQINKPTTDYIGLFGYTSSATITNLHLINANITGHSQVGILAGMIKNYSIVSNCYSTGSVLASLYFAGGLVGESSKNCLITNCYATGNVSANNNEAGGLVGENSDNSLITNCYSTGNVSANFSYAGGLVGYNYSGSISNCYATGNVTTNNYSGGLLGYNYNSSISNSYAIGNVSANNNEAGGLVGENNHNSTISYCYSTGSVSASNSKGGFCAVCDIYSSFTCCYWDTQTSGLNYGVDGGNVSGVTGLTDLQMRDANYFTCFDKSTIWVFDGLNYPQLRALFADKVPALTEWSRYILVFSVLLFGCYFVYRKLYA